MHALRPHVKLAGFIDNDPQKQDTHLCGHPVHGLPDILDSAPAAIFIASSWALDITSQLLREKALDPTRVIDFTLSLLLELEHAQRQSGQTILITGNSYAFNGFNADVFDHEMLNLALSSQDLATDYALVREAVHRLSASRIDAVFITLYHYIFDYEAAKRPGIDTSHIYSFLDSPNITASAYADIFHHDLNTKVRDSFSQTITPTMVRNAPASAHSRSNKVYPASQKRNVSTLNAMLAFLHEKAIRPIFLIMPMHDSYIAGISPTQATAFYAMVSELSKTYDVPVLDALKNQYPDTAYGDPTHLNRYGSRLFSQDVRAFMDNL
ncbi:hypothetical protein GO013_05350 [Pseudodesulfovibrio sp. JC047]|nr:hypothetical protein [Pseudodesulfovibrio sp. JC047]